MADLLSLNVHLLDLFSSLQLLLICGVIFESGSTATVLTLGSGIICPDWFDDENLEADTIYELNINEGLLSVGMWGAS